MKKTLREYHPDADTPAENTEEFVEAFQRDIEEEANCIEWEVFDEQQEQEETADEGEWKKEGDGE